MELYGPLLKIQWNSSSPPKYKLFTKSTVKKIAYVLFGLPNTLPLRMSEYECIRAKYNDNNESIEYLST